MTPKFNCQTEHTLLVGAEKWKPSSFISLIQKYGLDSKTAKHLSCAYGDQAYKVAELSKNHQFLSKNHQFVESEVVYACRREFACTAVDVLARRTRLAFLHAKDAFQALPNVIRIMSDEHGWDEKRRINEYKEGYEFLLTMGLELK